MRINRDRSRLTFRRRTRRGGCLTILVVIGVVIGAGVLSRDWIRQWFLLWLQDSVTPATLRDAQVAFANGDLDHAILYSQQQLYGASNNSAARILLVRALIYRSYTDFQFERDRQRALQLTTEAYQQFPFEQSMAGIHAFALQANGQIQEAERLALRAIQRNSDDLPARLALSLVYGNQGIFQAALREAERAVEIASVSALDWRTDAYRVLAIAYSDLGHYDDAAKAVEQAITYHNTLIPLHFERALYALQVGDHDTATAYYFNVIAINVDNVKARFRLCELSSTLREREAAIVYCSQVTERSPGWPEGWYQLGREYFLQGDFVRAQEALNRCSTLQVAQGIPNDQRRFECWYIQGQAAEVLGDCENLMTLYAEFQEMAEHSDIAETWIYPPGGPPDCATPVPIPGG